jgi:hypothetical protein
VETKGQLDQFIRVPWTIYAGDPMWIPPLLMERRQHFSKTNPYFEHAEWCAWIAYRGTKAVGRISAQVDQLHIQQYQDATGFFGMLEAEDNAETFKALTASAEEWLRQRGMRRIMGPFNLSINQESGLLVNGFGSPPSIMMGHALPYYGPRIEKQGYEKEKDLLAYILDMSFVSPPLIRDLPKRATQDIHVRPLQKSHFKEELKILRDVHEDAWSQNWGFIPFTASEFEQLGRDIKFLVDQDFVQIAEIQGKAAAMIVVLPNINDVICDLNGKLLPFGWLKLLWRLKVKSPSSARVPLMGVRRQYHDSLLGPVLAFMVIEAVRTPITKRGIRQVEMSWILEDNHGMRNIIESITGKAYKRYRIYAKQLDEAN